MSKFSALAKILKDTGSESKNIISGLGDIAYGAPRMGKEIFRAAKGDLKSGYGMGAVGKEALGAAGDYSKEVKKYLMELAKRNKKGAAALGVGAAGVGAGGAYGIDKLLEELED